MIRISTFTSEQYTKLEIFCKSKPNKTGKLLITDNKETAQTAQAGTGYYKWIKLDLQNDTTYDIQINDLDVSIAYLCGNPNILEEGICFLTFDPDVKKVRGSELSKFYDTPYREQYHFVPFKNWINDPNGLCWYKGNYHLFYQANPHKQEWDNMYWGHAVSKDLVHWTHLPYVFEPQQDVLENSAVKGGAFSGSAVPLENEVLFYLTRHFESVQDGSQALEWQTMSRSKDMLHFEEEKVIIREKPENAGCDFRDPKVFQIKNKWYLVLGSNLNGISAILLYSSDDMCNWTYENPLVIETDKSSATFECPDCFELDGKCVVVGALMCHVDDHKRIQMTKYYIGDFNNQKLDVQAAGWYDFGSNFYAVQSFEHEGKRIAIGWVSDFYDEHVNVPNGAYGSFAIPRVLSIRDFRLCMEPVPEIYSLKDEQIFSGNGEDVSLENIKGNSYYAKLQFSSSTDFKMILGESANSSILLERIHGVTKINTVGVKSENVEFIADVDEIEEIEIFVDRRVVEVYINHGCAVGTKLFYTQNKAGIFKASFEEPNDLTQIEVYTMKSIW